MKMIKKKFLELYEDRFSIAFTIALFTLANWLESFIVKDLSIMQGTGVVVGIVGLVVGTEFNFIICSKLMKLEKKMMMK